MREVVDEWMETINNDYIADLCHENDAADAPADAPAVGMPLPMEVVVSSDDATMTQSRVIQ